jgi:hypothetical protein
MFTSSLSDEVRALQEDIQAVEDKVDDPILCEKMKQFINSPPDVQKIFKADAAAEKLNIISVILRSEAPPTLNRPQLQRVMRANRAHAEYVRHRTDLSDSDEDEGPQNEDAWLFEDLTVLLKLYARLRDREQLIALIFEASDVNGTGDLKTDLRLIGDYFRTTERHHYYILYPTRTSLQGCQHCRLSWRFAKLYQRSN